MHVEDLLDSDSLHLHNPIIILNRVVIDIFNIVDSFQGL